MFELLPLSADYQCVCVLERVVHVLAVFDLLIAQDGFGGFHGLGIVDLQRRPGPNKSLGERNCRTLAYIVGEGLERQTPDSDLAVT